jgi:2-(1,2-epoxy-1,2-dihydrophenyl)acetyl-CoA isomerase
MEYQTLILKRENGIGTIILNRPEVLNAFNAKQSTEFGLAIEEVSKDDTIKVLIITGSGRAFCAGGDLKDLPFNPKDTLSIMEALESWHRVLLSLRQLEKPVIASINGPAAGGGFDLALMCDIRIASEDAKLVEAYINIGGTPDSGGTYTLPHLIGTAKACEILFTGDAISAREAERIGLVNKVVPANELENATQDLAARLTKKSPRALGLIKRAIYQSFTQDIEAALHNETYMMVRNRPAGGPR